MSRKKSSKKSSTKAAKVSDSATTEKAVAATTDKKNPDQKSVPGKKVSHKKKAAKTRAGTQAAKASRATNKAPAKIELTAATEENKTAKTVSEPAPAAINTTGDQPESGQNAGGMVKIALAVSLVAVGLAAYATYQITLGSRINESRLAGFEDRLTFTVSEQNNLKTGFDREVQDSAAELKRLDSQLGTVQTTVDELQTASRASIDDIKANLGQSVARWKLDEIHSLLTRLNRVYQLTGNQAQAIASLELVQSSIATIENPRLAVVNTALAEDIQQVRSANTIDINSMNGDLLGIHSVIPELVLAEDTRVAQAPKSATSASEDPATDAKEESIFDAGKSLLDDIGSLVKYKNLDAPLQPSLDNEARFIVYESLRLKIHAAMLALLRRDNPGFQSQLKLAGEVLNAYFDTQQPEVKTVVEQLKVLQTSDISLDAKAITRALEALDRVIVMEN